MEHRTNEDNQRDSMEEKEVYKSMKNNKEKSKEQLKEIIKKDYAKYTDKQVEELQKQIQSLKIDWDHDDMQQNYGDDDYELYSLEKHCVVYPIEFRGNKIWDSKGRKINYDWISDSEQEYINKNYREGGQIEE